MSKKKKRVVPVGVIHIASTFNNTIVTVTELTGDVLAWSTAGSCGFKGSKKSTPYAAQVASKEAAIQAIAMGMRTASVEVRGPGAGRESAIRALSSCDINITSIKDVTPIPHNGVRPAKKRRG